MEPRPDERATGSTLLALVIMLGIGNLAAPASARLPSVTTVRGNLQHENVQGRPASPARNVKVTLAAGGWRSPAAYSDSAGMYYIPNIKSGDYLLEVWVSEQPLKYRLQIKANPPRYTDVPVIKIK
jgi:hypothetical protein